jgi:hypothetical protein
MAWLVARLTAMLDASSPPPHPGNKGSAKAPPASLKL